MIKYPKGAIASADEAFALVKERGTFDAYLPQLDNHPAGRKRTITIVRGYVVTKVSDSGNYGWRGNGLSPWPYHTGSWLFPNYWDAHAYGLKHAKTYSK